MRLSPRTVRALFNLAQQQEAKQARSHHLFLGGQAEQAQASHLHFKLHKVVVQHLCSQLQRLNQYRVKREALQSVEDLHLRSRS